MCLPVCVPVCVCVCIFVKLWCISVCVWDSLASEVKCVVIVCCDGVCVTVFLSYQFGIGV